MPKHMIMERIQLNPDLDELIAALQKLRDTQPKSHVMYVQTECSNYVSHVDLRETTLGDGSKVYDVVLGGVR